MEVVARWEWMLILLLVLGVLIWEWLSLRRTVRRDAAKAGKPRE